VVGFEQSLLPLLNKQHQQALVLGNGGAAESVIHVLKKLGIEYDVVSRQLHAGSTLTYRELTREIIEQHPLIINTTPVGTFPETGSCPAIPYEGITSRHLLYDLVYNPPLTLFLQKGKERGAQVKNGEEMLVLQAEESWNIWNRD
jgi:shikimate dehydrogenase